MLKDGDFAVQHWRQGMRSYQWEHYERTAQRNLSRHIHNHIPRDSSHHNSHLNCNQRFTPNIQRDDYRGRWRGNNSRDRGHYQGWTIGHQAGFHEQLDNTGAYELLPLLCTHLAPPRILLPWPLPPETPPALRRSGLQHALWPFVHAWRQQRALARHLPNTNVLLHFRLLLQLCRQHSPRGLQGLLKTSVDTSARFPRTRP